MRWPIGDPDLVEYVRKQQLTALHTYEVNPDLLEEHVGQEESFRVGGYGQRQVSELLQNAVDALTMGGQSGTVEFRIADGALYCANEGSTFAHEGVRAVCYAFLSSKRGEDIIGRFGLGFKSVLGISDRPQLFSRSVSFEFNSPETASLFKGIAPAHGKLPLLRVPALIDVEAAIDDDPNLAELMKWASTVIKLPLARDGARIRTELGNFKTQSLLFMKSVSELRITLQDAAGLSHTSVHRRVGQPADGRVVLHSPKGPDVPWLYAERDYAPSQEVLQSLTATTSRKRMTVSYAVPLEGSTTTLGQLWAWFPLQDQTTARGIFNAPWQVNDDRTTLIPSSALNREMLDVSAELFLDVAVRASNSKDPAAHLDLFPARGREPRSAADSVLSDRIPELARKRAMIPDANGVLRGRGVFQGVPDLSRKPVPEEGMEAWLAVVPRTTMPHPSAFSTSRDRYVRLRALLRDDDDKMSPQETSIAAWLQELAHIRSRDSIRAALEIYSALSASGDRVAAASEIIPVSDGGWAAADTSATVLIPRSDQPSPDGVTLIDETFSAIPEIGTLLRSLGFRDVSIDQTARAIGSAATDSWGESKWFNFWYTVSRATTRTALDVVGGVRARGVTILVKTKPGTWRPAMEVFATEALVSGLDARQPDPRIHGGRSDLLEAAGALVGPAPDFPLHSEPIYVEYTNEITQQLERAVTEARHTHSGITVPALNGSGPLQVFKEFTTGDSSTRAVWTRKVLRTMQNRMLVIGVPLRDIKRTAELSVASPEYWAVLKYGLVGTSLGLMRPATVVAPIMRDYSSFLPVVEADAGLYLDAPRSLAAVRDSTFEHMLSRENYSGAVDRLTEVLVEMASRPAFKEPDHLPGLSQGVVVRRPRADIVLAMSTEDRLLLEEHGVPYLDGKVEGASRLAESWSLRTSEETLSRSLEIREEGSESPLVDRFPSLSKSVQVPIGKIRLRTSSSILRKTTSPAGMVEVRLMSARLDDVVIVDDSLDEKAVLSEVSMRLGLGLTDYDVTTILATDESLRRSDLVERAKAARSDPERLLIVAGVKALTNALPKGLLAAIENKRGQLSDIEIAELYWKVRGFDSLWTVREELRSLGLSVPRDWAGSPLAQAFVFSLGFATAYAGTKGVTAPPVTQVQGQVELKPLHDFQNDLAERIRDLAISVRHDGQANRGLLYLPTGAGKTRVTVEAIARMLRAGELHGPVLWIAQSEELCEQAIVAWTEVWRALGDERVIDICRFWDKYELDESDEELQIVVAVDDKLRTRIESSNARLYDWLSDASLVVIDEAHTALSKTYTTILRWLGLTATRTDRPLLGLTATPYRGRNSEVNQRFVERFGSNKLESLDPADPIGQLRRDKVLAEVDHYVLDGIRISAAGSELEEFGRMKEVTKSMLDRIGQDLDRMQTVVNDILRQDSSWPILVFAASVSSAHTIAALLRLEGLAAAAVDGSMRAQERRRVIQQFKDGEIRVIVNCDLLTQGFDAPRVRALYIARPTFSPNRYHQMIGRGLRGPKNGGTERCLIVNIGDTFEQFGEELAFTDFDYLWPSV